MQFVRAVHSVRWTIIGAAIFGLAIGGAFSPALQYASESYDVYNHVLKLKTDVVLATKDDIIVHATGEKVRNCEYVRLQAYTVNKVGVLSDALIVRVDQHEDRDSKPLGSFDFGTWRIWPRGDAVSLQVFTQYLCSGRMVVQKVIDVKVPG